MGTSSYSTLPGGGLPHSSSPPCRIRLHAHNLSRNRPGITSRLRPGSGTGRSGIPSGHNLGHVWWISISVLTEAIARRVLEPFRRTTTETMPTSTRRLSLQKKFHLDHRIRPRPLPMMSLEANRRGAFLGAVFSKIFDPMYRLSPRPRAEVFEFLEPPSPD
jgi:hypothetical protein